MEFNDNTRLTIVLLILILTLKNVQKLLVKLINVISGLKRKKNKVLRSRSKENEKNIE